MNKNITGIKVNNTSRIIDGSEKSLRATMKDIDDYYKLSALKINQETN